MARQPRWLTVPVLAVLVTAPIARAQAQSINLGVMAGASLSTFTGDFAADVKQNATFIGGAFVRLSALGFAVQPGLYYAGKSAKFLSDTPQETTTKLGYIQIPIVLRFHLGPLYVGGGPSLGIKIGCTSTPTSSGTSSDCADAAGAKSTEVSGIAEAGIEFGKISLGARADFGLTNAIEAINGGSTANITAKTRTVSAVLAVWF